MNDNHDDDEDEDDKSILSSLYILIVNSIVNCKWSIINLNHCEKKDRKSKIRVLD